jgi:hypothetical protein
MTTVIVVSYEDYLKTYLPGGTREYELPLGRMSLERMQSIQRRFEELLSDRNQIVSKDEDA